MATKAQKFFFYLYWLRVPLLTVAFLGILLPLGFETPLFWGLADLQARELKWVSFMAFLMAGSAMATANLIFLYGDVRMLDEPVPKATFPYPWWGAWVFLTGHLFYLPFLYSLWNFNIAQPNRMSLVEFTAYAFLGWLMAIGVILFLTMLQLLFSAAPPEASPGPFLILPLDRIRFLRGAFARLGSIRSPWSAPGIRAVAGMASGTVRRTLGRGPGFYVGGAMLPGIAFAVFMLFLFLAVYVAGGLSAICDLKSDWFCFYPIKQPRWVPTLFWVLLGASLVCWLLAAVAYFWDRFRVPTLTVVALFLVIVAYVPSKGDRDYFYNTVAGDAVAFPKPKEVMDLSRFHDRAIVVAAAGGGIQAAAWTARVLSGLHDPKVNPEFDRSVAAISAVSGGSVGTLFYLRSLAGFPEHSRDCSDGAEPLNTPFDPIQGAETSSLEAVAWGLVQPDLARALLPGFIRPWSKFDRGWALERSFAKAARIQCITLGDIAKKIKDGFPAVIFNSTSTETGTPFAFTSSRFPDLGEEPAGLSPVLDDFHDLTPGRDVYLETAVRMSASFPYVSPNARPRQTSKDKTAFHLADGGYYDNYGMAALNAWLREAIGIRELSQAATAKPLRTNSAMRRVLVVKIVSFPDDAAAPAKPETWFYQIVAPAITIYNARGQGQILREKAEFWALQSALHAANVDYEESEFRFAPQDKECQTNPPLSWHLSAREKACIDKAWTTQDVQEGVRRVQEFLRSPDGSESVKRVAALR